MVILKINVFFYSRLRSDSSEHSFHNPDFHLQVRRCAVHAAPRRVEAAAACRPVCPAPAWVEDVGHTEDGFWEPQQGRTAWGRGWEMCLVIIG